MRVALHSQRAHHTQDGELPATAPPPPAPTKPARLLEYPTEMALVVHPGLGLDGESDPVRRDRHRVDVPAESALSGAKPMLNSSIPRRAIVTPASANRAARDSRRYR